MPRALVTGASGFVGPHLAAALRATGHEVFCTDRSEPLAASDRHITCDLGDPEAVHDLFATTRPDWIFHLASQSSVARSFDAPRETLLGNLGAACNVLEALRQTAPRARLLVIGSAEEYGNVAEADLPIRETAPLRPASPYAVSKVAQELLAQQYAAAYDLDLVLVRSFNHSGPGQSDRFVLPGFARQVAVAEAGLQEPVLRVGNLDVWRDFLHVGDVVRAYIALAERGERADPYNVCRGEAYCVRDLLEALLGRARTALRVEVDPARWRPADLPVLRGDPEKLQARTGWTAQISIEILLGELLDDWRGRVAGGLRP